MRRFPSVAILVAVVAVLAAGGVATHSQTTEPVRLTVHEWGTFTSIAGEDGQALQWLPQGGVSDLPCFVERGKYNVKGALWGTVRMETPVLYFYAPSDVTVNVKVGFHRGLITEWYPQALVGVNNQLQPNYEGTIAWPNVKVSPSIAPEFPTERGASHYYMARATDATPVQYGLQKEKFLFYRGVGNFAPPISAKVDAEGQAVVWSSRDGAIGDVILFENRAGAIAYSVAKSANGRLTLERPSLDDESTAPKRELVTMLVANGLYRKEAEAMVATWSDSWFEEGVRLFYIVPRTSVDAILPLQITPAPADVARVFVGRMELVTPSTRREVQRALVADDRAALQKHGRFLYPIAERVISGSPLTEREMLRARLNAVAAAWTIAPSPCR
jgi:hypothetical protein